MAQSHVEIIWTDYMKYRARLRRFDLAQIEQIVRYSGERYLDTVTGRLVTIGHIEGVLVMIPYENNHHPCNHPCYDAPTNQLAAQNGEACE